MSGQQRRVGFIGLFGTGNLGNEGSLDALLRLVQKERPAAPVSCVCGNPDKLEARQNIAALPLSRAGFRSGWAQTLNTLLLKIPGRVVDFFETLMKARLFSILIVPGTGILDDFGEDPLAMPYTILKWTIAARLTGAKFAFVSIGAGPIRNPLSRALMTGAARLANYRSYRDQISKDFMESCGLDVSRDPVTPDLAFRLPRPAAAAPEPKVIGLGVMTYSGWSGADRALYDAYIEKISRFASWLIARGFTVQLMIGEDSDEQAIADVRSKVAATPEQLRYTPPSSLSELMGQMARAELIIATRFHNIVCAMAMAKPTISLGYAQKNDVLLREFGLGEFCQHTDTFDVERLCDQFERLYATRASYETAIRARLDAYHQAHQAQDAVLLGMIDGAAPRVEPNASPEEPNRVRRRRFAAAR